jgi:hypothetical protein
MMISLLIFQGDFRIKEATEPLHLGFNPFSNRGGRRGEHANTDKDLRAADGVLPDSSLRQWHSESSNVGKVHAATNARHGPVTTSKLTSSFLSNPVNALATVYRLMRSECILITERLSFHTKSGMLCGATRTLGERTLARQSRAIAGVCDVGKCAQRIFPHHTLQQASATGACKRGI